MVHEVRLDGIGWVPVPQEIFHAVPFPRRIDGKEYTGPVIPSSKPIIIVVDLKHRPHSSHPAPAALQPVGMQRKANC